MSGTSADAIDAVLVDFSPLQPQLLNSYSLPLPEPTRQAIFSLFTPGDNEIERLGRLDRELAYLNAQAVTQLLTLAQQPASAITAIGCHGQTLRHRPRLSYNRAFSLQIGDPNTLAELTGITTVADFRRRDIACGGQGAPLVPAFHQAVFSHPQHARALLNLGGIANITWLPPNAAPMGFDTGPANGLMDAWIQRHLGQAYDANGDWAAQGRVLPHLLQALLAHPFFALPPPKSTGKEDFSIDWLFQQITTHCPQATAVDIQATLLELTALSCCQALNRHCPGLQQLYTCGGGARNNTLSQRLAELLPQVSLATTARLGVDVQWVEAMAFAWLAMRCLQGLTGNLPSVTGAAHAAVLGGIYPAGTPKTLI